MTERIELSLTVEDKMNTGFVRSMQNLASTTGELLMQQKWPAELKLDCVPYLDREEIYPKAALPLFNVIHKADQNYEVSARFPNRVGPKGHIVEATWAEFDLQGPPADMWGWRIGGIVAEQLYWCSPEEIPPRSAHAARGALISLALIVQRLREGIPPVQGWAIRWQKTPRQG